VGVPGGDLGETRLLILGHAALPALAVAADEDAAIAAQQHRVEAPGGGLEVPHSGLGLGHVALAVLVLADGDDATIAA